MVDPQICSNNRHQQYNPKLLVSNSHECNRESSRASNKYNSGIGMMCRYIAGCMNSLRGTRLMRNIAVSVQSRTLMDCICIGARTWNCGLSQTQISALTPQRSTKNDRVHDGCHGLDSFAICQERTRYRCVHDHGTLDTAVLGTYWIASQIWPSDNCQQGYPNPSVKGMYTVDPQICLRNSHQQYNPNPSNETQHPNEIQHWDMQSSRTHELWPKDASEKPQHLACEMRQWELLRCRNQPIINMGWYRQVRSPHRSQMVECMRVDCSQCAFRKRSCRIGCHDQQRTHRYVHDHGTLDTMVYRTYSVDSQICLSGNNQQYRPNQSVNGMYTVDPQICLSNSHQQYSPNPSFFNTSLTDHQWSMQTVWVHDDCFCSAESAWPCGLRQPQPFETMSRHLNAMQHWAMQPSRAYELWSRSTSEEPQYLTCEMRRWELLRCENHCIMNVGCYRQICLPQRPQTVACTRLHNPQCVIRKSSCSLRCHDQQRKQRTRIDKHDDACMDGVCSSKETNRSCRLSQPQRVVFRPQHHNAMQHWGILFDRVCRTRGCDINRDPQLCHGSSSPQHLNRERSQRVMLRCESVAPHLTEVMSGHPKREQQPRLPQHARIDRFHQLSIGTIYLCARSLCPKCVHRWCSRSFENRPPCGFLKIGRFSELVKNPQGGPCMFAWVMSRHLNAMQHWDMQLSRAYELWSKCDTSRDLQLYHGNSKSQRINSLSLRGESEVIHIDADMHGSPKPRRHLPKLHCNNGRPWTSDRLRWLNVSLIPSLNEWRCIGSDCTRDPLTPQHRRTDQHWERHDVNSQRPHNAGSRPQHLHYEMRQWEAMRYETTMRHMTRITNECSERCSYRPQHYSTNGRLWVRNVCLHVRVCLHHPQCVVGRRRCSGSCNGPLSTRKRGGVYDDDQKHANCRHDQSGPRTSSHREDSCMDRWRPQKNTCRHTWWPQQRTSDSHGNECNTSRKINDQSETHLYSCVARHLYRHAYRTRSYSALVCTDLFATLYRDSRIRLYSALVIKEQKCNRNSMARGLPKRQRCPNLWHDQRTWHHVPSRLEYKDK